MMYIICKLINIECSYHLRYLRLLIIFPLISTRRKFRLEDDGLSNSFCHKHVSFPCLVVLIFVFLIDLICWSFLCILVLGSSCSKLFIYMKGHNFIYLLNMTSRCTLFLITSAACGSYNACCSEYLNLYMIVSLAFLWNKQR